MTKRTVTVNLSLREGKIKPCCGVVGGVLWDAGSKVDFSEEFKTAKIPFASTRGVTYPGRGNLAVDLDSIFPDFSGDATDPNSYNFEATDLYLKAIKDSGTEIFLSLGESENPYPKNPRHLPPHDTEKLGDVFCGIIAHYNEGWASGFKFNIKFCEIYPGADSPDSIFSGPEEYFSLYYAVAAKLKERFPKLKVGGFSSGGFRSLNHFDATETDKGYVSFLEAFLSLVSKNKAPLDFLSWKCETDSPEEISLHSSYAKSFLGQYGLKKASCIISAFNLTIGENTFDERNLPAYLCSSYIISEKSGVDMLFYSDAYPGSRNNIFFTVDDGRNKRLYSGFHSMAAFGSLAEKKNRVFTTPDERREIYTLATLDSSSCSVLIVTREYSGILEIDLQNSPFCTYSIKGMIGGGERGMGYSTEKTGIPIKDAKITINAGKCQVYLINLS